MEKTVLHPNKTMASALNDAIRFVAGVGPYAPPPPAKKEKPPSFTIALPRQYYVPGKWIPWTEPK